MNKKDILQVIYGQKDYQLAEKLCSSSIQNDENLLMLARVLFYEKKYERAEILFKKLHNFTEVGYCRLYQGDKKSADLIWSATEGVSPLTLWAKSLSGYLEKKETRKPTFFQIRNFYESDLETLMSLNMMNYAENLINSIPYFSYINPEVYKFTARVLYLYKYYKLAEKFISAGKEQSEDDSELYYIEAQIRIAQNEKIAAIKSLERILEISPSYYPAHKLLKQIK